MKWFPKVTSDFPDWPAYLGLGNINNRFYGIGYVSKEYSLKYLGETTQCKDKSIIPK